ncbi:unnamed protein product [Didymodactylos carnosus]|uniref:Uncharacterized protein n=1 Tax=Didymodactylos carnosus TaxID=1234261 RepID=A0A8S2URF1_9BILA|nr:unnamed protein product [Didymodactylos carnosus]CAF4358559.1 unnamed protein product [Didymodactylos carnosus]
MLPLLCEMLLFEGGGECPVMLCPFVSPIGTWVPFLDPWWPPLLCLLSDECPLLLPFDLAYMQQHTSAKTYNSQTDAMEDKKRFNTLTSTIWMV